MSKKNFSNFSATIFLMIAIVFSSTMLNAAAKKELSPSKFQKESSGYSQIFEILPHDSKLCKNHEKEHGKSSKCTKYHFFITVMDKDGKQVADDIYGELYKTNKKDTYTCNLNITYGMKVTVKLNEKSIKVTVKGSNKFHDDIFKQYGISGKYWMSK